MILKILIIAYGVLSIIAALAQGKYKNISKKSALLMGSGGVLIVSALFFNSMTSVFILAVGVLACHISALLNGIEMYGKVNRKHNLVRLVFSAYLVASQAMLFMTI